jgi:chitinase
MAPYIFSRAQTDHVLLSRKYPVASSRSGRDVDFENFPKFLARLKDALSGASKGLTITLPASSRYLQHFDLASLVCSRFLLSDFSI